jgi:hypothetical protein
MRNFERSTKRYKHITLTRLGKGERPWDTKNTMKLATLLASQVKKES